MTPQQRTDWIIGLVKEARRWDISREDFVGSFNQMYDAVEGVENRLTPAAQSEMLLSEKP